MLSVDLWRGRRGAGTGGMPGGGESCLAARGGGRDRGRGWKKGGLTFLHQNSTQILHA